MQHGVYLMKTRFTFVFRKHGNQADVGCVGNLGPFFNLLVAFIKKETCILNVLLVENSMVGTRKRPKSSGSNVIPMANEKIIYYTKQYLLKTINLHQ